jgi:hypothetical protein
MLGGDMSISGSSAVKSEPLERAKVQCRRPHRSDDILFGTQISINCALHTDRHES